MFFPRFNYSAFISFSCYLFLTVGIVMLLIPPSSLPDYIHHPTFLGLSSLFASLFIWLPSRLLSSNTELKKLSVIHIQASICFALIVNGAGELGLFELSRYGIPYDKIAHCVVSGLIVYILCENIFIRLRWSRTLIIIVSTFLAFWIGIAWEIFEAISDVLFETRVWGIYGEQIVRDTITDIIFNICGIVIASLLFWKQSTSVGIVFKRENNILGRTLQKLTIGGR